MDIELRLYNTMDTSALLKSLSNIRRPLVLCAPGTRAHLAIELDELTRLSHSASSKHLGRLQEERIAATRRDTWRVFYTLANASAVSILATPHGLYCVER